MDLTANFWRVAVAAGLGLLVGLQRERAKTDLAGMRTFTLITLLGAVCALLAQSLGGWVVAAGFLALAAQLLMGNFAKLQKGPVDPGLTTETAALVMFGVGAYLVVGEQAVAIAMGGGVAVLLQFKGQLHGLAERLGDEDLKAIMQFALLSLVILPVLPDRTYGPYAVLNPRQIWWMVVLIVGISLGGYIAYKFLGRQAGVVLGGILGGLISSTATTVSYARRTAHAQEGSLLAATVIMIASAVSVARVLVICGVVAPSFLPAAGPPLLVLLAALAALSAVVWLRGRRQEVEMPAHENPTEMKSALVFAFLYSAVLLAVAAAKARFGSRGLFLIAGLSGLTDMDAITLSTAQLVGNGMLEAETGWKVILVALLSNLVFKGGAVAVLGHRQLVRRIAPLYGASLAGGVLLLLLWPGLS
jgi:uncharacterized membrane protein (DUF4010 family)